MELFLFYAAMGNIWLRKKIKQKIHDQLFRVLKQKSVQNFDGAFFCSELIFL
jgi:hypothetical protein